MVFQPGSSTELASVADDSSLLFWDTRSGVAPVLRMGQAHGESDLHVVDWSALRPELVATGLLVVDATCIASAHIAAFACFCQCQCARRALRGRILLRCIAIAQPACCRELVSVF